jgi:RNA polymerase sigma factor (sigma-70 family)
MYLTKYNLDFTKGDDIVNDTLLELLHYLHHKSDFNRSVFIDAHKKLMHDIMNSKAYKYIGNMKKNGKPCYHASIDNHEIAVEPDEYIRDIISLVKRKLDRESRKILDLKYNHSLSNREVAKCLNMLEPKVSKKLKKIRKTIIQLNKS